MKSHQSSSGAYFVLTAWWVISSCSCTFSRMMTHPHLLFLLSHRHLRSTTDLFAQLWVALLYFVAFDVAWRFRTAKPSIIFSLCSFTGALLTEVVACSRKAKMVVVCSFSTPVSIIVFQSFGSFQYCCLKADVSFAFFVDIHPWHSLLFRMHTSNGGCGLF